MSHYYLLSANPKKYDIKSAFEKWGFVDWTQKNNIKYELNNIVYIYSTKPFQTIRYKTKVIEVNNTREETVDDSEFWGQSAAYNDSLTNLFMRLELLEEFDLEEFKLENLKRNGLKSAPQGPMKVREPLLSYLEKIEHMHSIHPEEINEDNLYEGFSRKVLVNKYERNNKARQQCLEYYGYDCSVCNMNFQEEYGEVGKNFIHVHHIIPLSEINGEYEVDPIKDLRPVCPNCHAMIHRGLDFKF